ncbi:glycerophosphodiester phosphodiesterase GDPDL7-like [Vicia villosa]|uniref:glycerophosphodiester phosphodiesterase GDPDL7-like n=1 Tax=Vicia villosa TaxID=3911 RepID=UPI00273C5E6B|nr:glycerophosphodiester phosphodiesterase GDPDL7-like [Vicia villosa]
MDQPEGFVIHGQENKICKLDKSIYVLKQAPKKWHEKFDNLMISNGYKVNESDKCIHYKYENRIFTIIRLYVDDLLIFGSNIQTINDVKSLLNNNFDMKYLKEASVILGINITRSKKGISLGQSHYMDKILKKYNYFDCKPTCTSPNPSVKLFKNIDASVRQREYKNNKMLRSLFLVLMLVHATLPIAPQIPVPAKKWSTLSGNEPLVIARGGFTGLFPEGSSEAIGISKEISIFLCNVQFTKDAGAFCVTGGKLDNTTTIAMFDPNEKTYNINGNDVRGHFMVDYTAAQINHNVSMNQAIFSRPSFYDGLSPVLNVDGILSSKTPPRLWLNFQYEKFYNQHGVKLVDKVLEMLRLYTIDFVSSPEIGFLRSINGKVRTKTKFVFQFLNASDVEPTTNQPYDTIVKDLAAIKSYASGIMVPKEYIWPVKPDKYLGPLTTLVSDAHKQGLEVYASGFANDFFSSYDYNYDPTAEYLQFIAKDESVDGLVTDFPSTASNSIACFALNNTLPKKGQPLIISNNGASGVYPGSTDLAYQQAIDDGADIIDCSVQMTKDGFSFCSNTADLMADTTAMTKFMSRTSNIPEIQPNSGIFSFDLTWNEIQSLQPQISSPLGSDFQRNPANKNSGKFVMLSEFLELAKDKAVTGILINIENAAYLASNKGLDIVGTVSTALSNATFDKQATQQVLIQSDDSSVLSKYKDIPSYKRVLLVENIIGNAPKESVDEIKKYAEAVNLRKTSVIKASGSLLTGMTNVVKEMKDANLTVFVRTLRNEFISLAFDYWSDPNVEIATYIHSAKVDGIVTDFPATTSRYLRSPCSDLNNVATILPAKAGELESTVSPTLMPPAEAPLPPLEVGNIVDPPLPAVTNDNPPATPSSPPPSHAYANAANLGLSLVAIIVLVINLTL